jgi:hypothetical protein
MKVATDGELFRQMIMICVEIRKDAVPSEGD